MYDAIEFMKAYQAKKRAQREFDEWMAQLIKRNGVTKY